MAPDLPGEPRARCKNIFLQNKPNSSIKSYVFSKFLHRNALVWVSFTPFCPGSGILRSALNDKARNAAIIRMTHHSSYRVPGPIRREQPNRLDPIIRTAQGDRGKVARQHLALSVILNEVRPSRGPPRVIPSAKIHLSRNSKS